MQNQNNKNNITVTIMERDFNIKCPTDKVIDLHKAAKYLDNKIHEARPHGSKVLNLESLVVTAALNVIYELFAHKKENNNYINNMNQEIKELQNKLELALDETSY